MDPQKPMTQDCFSSIPQIIILSKSRLILTLIRIKETRATINSRRIRTSSSIYSNWVIIKIKAFCNSNHNPLS